MSDPTTSTNGPGAPPADSLADWVTIGGLAGRIVGLFAAGEVEEQVHELGRRRIAAGDLRRCRRGYEQQRGQRRTGEADQSHARIPSVAPGKPEARAGGRGRTAYPPRVRFGHRPKERCSRRRSRVPSPNFTMSNSAVFFVPAARCCARVSRFLSRPSPLEGWAERRQAHYFVCRVCETRLVRASEARRVP